MLVKGSVGNRALAVLIDSDSTHIIDEQAVDNTGYVAENPAFEHLLLVSNTLLFHFLYAKRSKCSFGQSKEYLGHVLKDMEEWPTPRTVKALRGFLGVTGYYRKYVPNYERIIRLLSDLLKKNVIVRIEEADQSVAAIKKVMSATPMLALPNS
uniref:Reverse transcriptase/retrotransposon-derived protein RNase H-like domain-containing protein n=1 Tax=Solanum lycopersicum TaxID=4081 RepID=A0A3Q7IEI7_SOLLC